MKTLIMTCLLLSSLLGVSQAQKKIEDFLLKDVISNDEYSLKSFPGSQGIAIIFASTECPYFSYYEDRIIKLINTYSSRGISFLLINSNFGGPSSAEKIDKMRIHAQLFGVPYLTDMAQVVRDNLGARKNPEAFLIKSDNGSYSIIYQGAIDDNPQVSDDVRTNYFEDALRQFLSGRNPKPNYVNPTGCIIKRR